MGLSYLNDKNWSDITREERLFCAELYYVIKGNGQDFINWLTTLDEVKQLKLKPSSYWEVAFEVCFYRDLFKSFNSSAKEKGFSDQRTFDLCLFSEDQIVIIEAKAQSGFEGDQLINIEKDKQHVTEAIKKAWNDEADLDVYIVALTSSQYSEKVPEVFDGYFSWKNIYDSFCRRNVFLRADDIYKK